MKKIILLALLLGGCGPYERLDQSCLNNHVRAAPGRIVPTPDGGWQIVDTGPVYTPLVVTQPPVGSDISPASDGSRDGRLDVEAERTAMRALVCTVME